MKYEARNSHVAPWLPLPAAPRALALLAGAASSDHRPTGTVCLPRALGPYPCPRGFALSVPLPQGETLVPMAADGISVLAPLAGSLALVRAAGGFQTEYVDSTGVESCLLFERVPCLEAAMRRLSSVARELLALGADALPAGERLLFRPALEVRARGDQTLSVHIYGEGRGPSEEHALRLISEGMLPALTNLVETSPRSSTRQRRRQCVLVRCRIGLSDFVAAIPRQGCLGPHRARQVVGKALRELAAARSLPALARAQNDALLGSVASVARALGDDDQWLVEEGHRYAARLGTVRPLASLELDGDSLVATLQLPSSMALHPDGIRESAGPAPELPELPRGHSADVSACVGLAAHLARAKGVISLAMGGSVSRKDHSVKAPVYQRSLRAGRDIGVAASGGVQQTPDRARASQRAEEFCMHSILIAPRSPSNVSAGLPASR